MELIKNCVALDTESRRLPGSSTYHWLSVAVVGPGGAILHMPVRPIGLELEEIEMFNNPPFSPEILFQANPPSVVRNMVKELLRGLTVLVWNEKHEAEQLAFLTRGPVGRKCFVYRMLCVVQHLTSNTGTTTSLTTSIRPFK